MELKFVEHLKKFLKTLNGFLLKLELIANIKIK